MKKASQIKWEFLSGGWWEVQSMAPVADRRQNVSQSYYCSTHFPFLLQTNSIQASKAPAGRNAARSLNAAWEERFVCVLRFYVIVCHARRETVETRKENPKSNPSFF